jgi:hypothetical protein
MDESLPASWFRIDAPSPRYHAVKLPISRFTRLPLADIPGTYNFYDERGGRAFLQVKTGDIAPRKLLDKKVSGRLFISVRRPCLSDMFLFMHRPVLRDFVIARRLNQVPAAGFERLTVKLWLSWRCLPGSAFCLYMISIIVNQFIGSKVHWPAS